jgi:hypothetical protein
MSRRPSQHHALPGFDFVQGEAERQHPAQDSETIEPDLDDATTWQ